MSAKTPAVGTTYEYDGMGRLLQIKHGSIAQYDYQWDAASRIIGINDSRDKRKYDYDKTSQLVGATCDKLPAEKYEYDLNGNRRNFTTGKNNQLLNDGESSYTYDAEGNRISKDNTKYHWDHRNRLVKVELPNETVEYVYDYRNRLVRRKSSKSTEYFIHDGWQIVQVLDATGKITGQYLWGAWQDELISENGNYALCDHLGTVRDMVDSSGKVISHLEYNVFGQLLSSTGQKPRFRYTGKIFDDDIGLQWNINRWYDPNVGRWISEDSIGFYGGSFNIYMYVKNASITNTDSLGLYEDYFKLLGEKIQTTISENVSFYGRCSHYEDGTTFSIEMYEHIDRIGVHGGAHGHLDWIVGMTFLSELKIFCCPNWSCFSITQKQILATRVL